MDSCKRHTCSVSHLHKRKTMIILLIKFLSSRFWTLLLQIFAHCTLPSTSMYSKKKANILHHHPLPAEVGPLTLQRVVVVKRRVTEQI